MSAQPKEKWVSPDEGAEEMPDHMRRAPMSAAQVGEVLSDAPKGQVRGPSKPASKARAAAAPVVPVAPEQPATEATAQAAPQTVTVVTEPSKTAAPEKRWSANISTPGELARRGYARLAQLAAQNEKELEPLEYRLLGYVCEECLPLRDEEKRDAYIDEHDIDDKPPRGPQAKNWIQPILKSLAEGCERSVVSRHAGALAFAMIQESKETKAKCIAAIKGAKGIREAARRWGRFNRKGPKDDKEEAMAILATVTPTDLEPCAQLKGHDEAGILTIYAVPSGSSPSGWVMTRVYHDEKAAVRDILKHDREGFPKMVEDAKRNAQAGVTKVMEEEAAKRDEEIAAMDDGTLADTFHAAEDAFTANPDDRGRQVTLHQLKQEVERRAYRGKRMRDEPPPDPETLVANSEEYLRRMREAQGRT